MDRNLRIRMLLEAGDRFSKPLRDLATGGRTADAALKGARDRLREIERTQANVGAFRQLKTDSLATGRALDAAKARVGDLSRAMAQTETPTRAMARDLDRARREVASLTRQHESEEVRLQELRSALRAAGVATADLARHDRELRAAKAGANRALEEQLSRTERLADRQRRLGAARARFGRTQEMAGNIAGAGAGAIAGGVAVGAGLWDGVKAAQTFESVMTDIAQKADLSRVQAARMGKELLGAARAANQLPEDLQSGVDVLAGFGLKPDQAVRMMKPIGRAATAYKAEIADLSAAAFAANDNLKVPVEQTARVIDVMAAAGKAGAFEIKDMAGAFPALTAGYQALGQTGVGAVADLSAALQIARKGAGDSATAANNVANLIQKISSPATVKSFAKLGVDLPAALKKAYQDGKTPLEAIAELTQKATGGDLSKLGNLFEDSQVLGALRPLIQNLKEYRRIRAEAFSAKGVTDRDFAERMKDSAEQTKALTVNAKVLAVNLGTLLLPAVNGVTARLAALTGWIASAADRHPLLAKGAAVAAAGLATLMVTFGVLAIGAAAILGPIGLANAGLVAMGVAGGAASIGLWPIVGVVAAVVGGVALLAGAAYLVYRSWGPVSGFFDRLWNSITGFFTQNWTTIRNLLLGAVVIFMPLVAAGMLLAKKIYDNWDSIKSSFLSGVGFLWTMVGPIVRPFLSILAAIGGLVGRFVQMGWDIVRGIGKGILGATGWLLKLVGNLAGSIGQRFANALGIRSPSRVFMGLGGHVMAGLDQGLRNSADRPLARVATIAGAVATTFAGGAMASAMDMRGAGARQALSRGNGALAQFRAADRQRGAAAASAAGAGAPTTIIINAAPGQSERSIAQEVERILAERDRRARADRRATFRDDPDGADL